MNAIYEAAVELQRFCTARGWNFCVIGAVAVARWGEPRATQDVDITLLTGFGGEKPYLDALLEAFPARVDDPRKLAAVSRVVVIAASNGTPLDVTLAGMPFEEKLLGRASDHLFEEGVVLRTVSAEDLVVMKLVAGRPRDLGDVEGILVRQGERLDWDLIERGLTDLHAMTDGELDGLPALREIRERVREWAREEGGA